MVKDIVEKVAESPAYLLDKTVTTSAQVGNYVTGKMQAKKAKDYWQDLGPGLTTGAADDDPSGIATYSQAGAAYGFQLLWMAFFTFPLMAVVQEMCARIGIATGRGLAANIRRFFPNWVVYLVTILLLIANTLNIGADLGAMAAASKLLVPQANYALLLILFTAVSVGLQIFTRYEDYAKYLKWLALILLSYIVSAFLANLDYSQLLRNTFIPSITFSRDQAFLICAVLGTTISPYLFFWQTSQEVEEEIMEGKTTIASREASTSKKQIKKMRKDVWFGMFLSNLVMFFIIAACGATLFPNGITNIETSAQAAQALRPLAGNYAYILFTLGIIGTGMLAVPVLAGASAYALSEALEWKFGLHNKLSDAYAFYGVIIFSFLIGLTVNFVGIDPIKMLIYSAVANGLIAPLILALIVIISMDKKIMGAWRNHPAITVIGSTTALIMVIAGVATILSIF